MTLETSCNYQTTPPGAPDGPGLPGGPDDLSPRPLGINDFETPGRPQPYAFLIQRPLVRPADSSDAPFGFVPVAVRAFDALGAVVPPAIVQAEWDPSWTWQVTTADADIRQACMGRWYAQAACAAGLTVFTVRNAEGVLFSQPLPAGKQSLFGEFLMQGFRIATIKTIAVDWASTPPGPTPLGGLPSFVELDLVGGQAPASALDRLHLVARCNGGVQISEFYHAQIKLRISTE